MTRIRKIIICMTFAVTLASFCVGLAYAKKERMTEELAKEVFRFHVLANSDSKKDQELKLEVKEAVLDYMKTSLPETADVDDTHIWATSHLKEIENVAETVVLAKGYTYAVHAKVGTFTFPEKTYGDITFPQGAYEALRVEIGAAKGQNWWCVLYPNLCFVNAVKAVVPEESKQELKTVLEEDTYDMITKPPKWKIKWFFFGQ